MSSLSANLRSRQRVDAPAPDSAKIFRTLERGRRGWRKKSRLPAAIPVEFTSASFVLDGLLVGDGAVMAASKPIDRTKGLRSRSTSRLRNHIAIVKHIARRSGRGRMLRPTDVLRWYTNISSGLSTTLLSMGDLQRLDAIVERVNSRQARVEPALGEIAELYCELLDQPLFPSFNGILARLLLTAHLAQNGLPPVVFDPQRDAALVDPTQCITRLSELLKYSLDAVIA